MYKITFNYAPLYVISVTTIGGDMIMQGYFKPKKFYLFLKSIHCRRTVLNCKVWDFSQLQQCISCRAIQTMILSYSILLRIFRVHHSTQNTFVLYNFFKYPTFYPATLPFLATNRIALYLNVFVTYSVRSFALSLL